MAPEGVIVGGWSYVIGAYAVVAAGLAIYALSLVHRLRAAKRQLESAGIDTAGAPRSASRESR